MMKAPGSLSFSRAMAAGENGRAQRWHGENQHTLKTPAGVGWDRVPQLHTS